MFGFPFLKCIVSWINCLGLSGKDWEESFLVYLSQCCWVFPPGDLVSPSIDGFWFWNLAQVLESDKGIMTLCWGDCLQTPDWPYWICLNFTNWKVALLTAHLVHPSFLLSIFITPCWSGLLLLSLWPCHSLQYFHPPGFSWLNVDTWPWLIWRFSLPIAIRCEPISVFPIICPGLHRGTTTKLLSDVITSLSSHSLLLW